MADSKIYTDILPLMLDFKGVQKNIMAAAREGKIAFATPTGELLPYDELEILERNQTPQKGVTYKEETGFAVVCQNFRYMFESLKRAQYMEGKNREIRARHMRIEVTNLQRALEVFTSFYGGWQFIKGKNGWGNANNVMNANRSPYMTIDQMLSTIRFDAAKPHEIDVNALMEARLRVQPTSHEIDSAVHEFEAFTAAFQKANVDDHDYKRWNYIKKMLELMSNVRAKFRGDKSTAEIDSRTVGVGINFYKRVGQGDRKRKVDNWRYVFLYDFDKDTFLRYLADLQEANKSFEYDVMHAPIAPFVYELLYQNRLNTLFAEIDGARDDFTNTIRSQTSMST